MPDPQQPVNQDTSPTKIASPIGVPGGVYQGPTGDPYYQGYQAQQPWSVPLGYADPMNATAGAVGLSATGTRGVQPRYFDGAQYQPANMGVDDMISLQQGLFAAGLYGGDYTLGVWGPNDVAAYERLLSMANYAGQDEKTTLDRAVQGAKADAKPKRAPLVIKRTSPDDLKATLKNVSQELYGGNLPDEDIQRFIDSYGAMESSAQQQAYNLSDPDAGGGTVIAPSDPTVAAEKMIRETHPDQVQVTAFGSKFNDILKTLTSTPSGTV